MYDYVQDQGHAWIPVFLRRRRMRDRPGAPVDPAHQPGFGPGETRRGETGGPCRSRCPRRHPVAPAHPRPGDRTLGPAAEQGLYRPDVRHFSLVGVIWDNPDTELYGRVEVRTRAARDGRWSGWQDVETHNHEHAADPDSAERASGRVRGSTAPLWVGDSNGVEVRVRAEGTGRALDAGAPLPSGLRLELVDPGAAPAAPGRQGARALDPAEPDPSTESPESEPESEQESEPGTANADLAQRGVKQVKPFIGARPKIITRRDWGADETLRERGFVYTKTVKAAFVHHTASGNKYWCSQVPSVIRGIYRYHVLSSGWRDIGYNFLVDRCGNIYEGRAGGMTKPVRGAHTLGFNTNSMGIAVIGTFTNSKPSQNAVKAIARLTAWKLGLYGVNPNGKTYLTSGGGNLYRKGKNVRLNVISGHRDGFATECPGRLLYGQLGTARKTAAKYQGR